MTSPFVTHNFHRFSRYATHSNLEELHSGMQWSEGPVWFADTQCLLFTDIPSNKILRWVNGQSVSVHRSPSNKSNGLTRDRQGRLVACESGARRVTRTELNGEIKIVADAFNGAKLNSPNDVVVGSDGSIWFTDPDYGIRNDYTGFRATREQAACNVFRVDGMTGEIRSATSEMSRPNGLAFSPDEKTLYVADSGISHNPQGPHHIVAFDVIENSLANRRIFAEIEGGVPDGFRVDVDGNLWICSVYNGIQVFASDGELIGQVNVPGSASNLCFGGDALNRLFITCGPKLYSLYTGTRGLSTV